MRRNLRTSRVPLLSLILLALAAPLHAADEWRAEFLFGGAHNFDSNLSISQAGHEDLDINAQWNSQSLTPPVLWDVRISWRRGDHGVALELLHHKLYLDNPPAAVQEFAISHGFNILSLQYRHQRTWRHASPYAFGALGVVIAHPENTVRNLTKPESGGWFDAGYELTGPSISLGVGAHSNTWHRMFLTLEGRFMWSRATVGVVDGEARLHNAALFLLGGFGVRL